MFQISEELWALVQRAVEDSGQSKRAWLTEAVLKKLADDGYEADDPSE